MLKDASHIATARVMAEGVLTRYRRCGSGPTVVLLERGQDHFEPLIEHFRVIAPEVPIWRPGPEWLRGVFDGLGINLAVIACEPSCRQLASDFAEQDPDRVRGVVSLDEADLQAALRRWSD